MDKMQFTVLVCVLACMAGAAGYIIAARLDRRGRARDVYDAQLECAAAKLGLLDKWAAIVEETQCPSDSPASRTVLGPEAWRVGSLAYSEYLVIPRPAIARMPRLWQARFMNLLQKLIAERRMGRYRFVVALKDPDTNHFVKDPLARPSDGRSHKKKV